MSPVTIHVVSEAEAEKANYVVCVRVCDTGFPDIPNSYKANCFACGAPVWVAPSAPMMPARICLICAGRMAGAH
jgi:hypothetical protein